VTTSELGRWEIFRVLNRKESEGAISPGSAELIFQQFLADVVGGAVTLIPMSSAVEDRFRHILVRLSHPTTPAAVIGLKVFP
jgi:hypothetical protein